MDYEDGIMKRESLKDIAAVLSSVRAFPIPPRLLAADQGIPPIPAARGPRRRVTEDRLALCTGRSYTVGVRPAVLGRDLSMRGAADLGKPVCATCVMFNDLTGNTRITRRALLRGALLGGGGALLGGWAKPELSFATDSASPVAETVYGKVRGVTIQGVRIYRGIPYGGPTQGARRFMPPSRPEQWAGVFEATHNGPRSPQGGGTNSIFTDARLGAYFSGGRTDAATLAAQTESENCLVLNVLTPGHRGRLPVMVYIHGGGFTQGSGVLTAFSDRFVREHNVVLVGVNHRLGALGYTYLGAISEKYADSGNVGQLDLIAALDMGARQHRELRRRPGKGDDFR